MTHPTSYPAIGATSALADSTGHNGRYPALWDRWESRYAEETGLIPGAKTFIESAEGLGVTIVYITNHMARNKAATIEALKHNGLNVDNIGARLLSQETTSDKTSRRQRDQTGRAGLAGMRHRPTGKR